MLKVLPRHRAKGFTLIELMLGLALLALLMKFAIPGFSTYLNNQKMRSQGESILSGLQTARNEALRRNTPVSFFLTSDAPSDGATAIGGNVNGPNWMVVVSPAVVGGPMTLIDSQVGREGGGEQSVDIVATVPNLSFTPLGQTTLVAPMVITLTPDPIMGQCVAAGGNIRCLNVEVGTTGQVPSLRSVDHGGGRYPPLSFDSLNLPSEIL